MCHQARIIGNSYTHILGSSHADLTPGNEFLTSVIAEVSHRSMIPWKVPFLVDKLLRKQCKNVQSLPSNSVICFSSQNGMLLVCRIYFHFVFSAGII